MQRELELKSGYETFKSSQAIVAFEQNPQLCLYETRLQKAQFYQFSLSYQNRKRVKRNTSYLDRGQELY